ncbi:MAG: winged helix-turn-helix transcriptional regulator [Roseivivax sp.]|nr:winged helix-turn-helix transcriptional regulator [Roseivivax sp.]
MKRNPEEEENLPNAPTPEIRQIVALLTRVGIVSQLYHSIMAENLVGHGLTVAQFQVLAHLSRREKPQRITDIARAVDVGQPAVTKMLAKFENAGWVSVVEESSDRRSRLASVTPAGHDHLRRVQPQLFPGLVQQLLAWPAEDRERFLQDLTRFSASLEVIRQLDAPR